MPFYFDYNATTPVSPEVRQVLDAVACEAFGNASSIHSYGQAARRYVDEARDRVAAFLGCDAKEVVFTSGGTEADNLAVLGTVRAATGRRHVITTAIEHEAVLASCEHLAESGEAELTVLPVDGEGRVDPDDVRRAIRPETVLISVMHANNETGVIQPLEEIVDIAREAGVRVHSDGVQAAGKITVDVSALGVDLYAISGHKNYAPKGTGVLYVKKDTVLAPLLFGGRGENGYRAGTQNVPGSVALGAAAHWKRSHLAQEAAHVGAHRNRLEQSLMERLPAVAVNGGGAQRVPNTANVRFDGIEAEALVIALDLKGFAVSTGAACSSGAVEPSHVLTAMGLSKEKAKSSIRFSLGRWTTDEEVDGLIEAVVESVERLRKVSATFQVHAG